MKVTIERTRVDRMTDMVVVRFSPPRTRLVSFLTWDFEQKFGIKLERGEKRFVNLKLEEIKNERSSPAIAWNLYYSSK